MGHSARLQAQQLSGMTLIPAPKYGQALLRSWARKHQFGDHLVEPWRPNMLGYISAPDGIMDSECERLIGLRCLSRLGRGAFAA